MSEIRKMLALWSAAEAAGEEWAVATVIQVEGSSYRKPGARMLLTRSGSRSGMVSGGCLEGEISRKIWWLTENGPAVQRYVSSFDDDAPAGEHPAYGLGCGGTVYVLMERASTARAILLALQASVESREPCAVLTVVESTHRNIPIGARMIVARPDIAQPDIAQPELTAPALTHSALASSSSIRESTLPPGLEVLAIATQTLEHRRYSTHTVAYQDQTVRVFAEYVSPPFALFICGAGDDAQPLAELAHIMGWHTTIADGRSNLVRTERFPRGDSFAVLDNAVPQLGLSIGPVKLSVDHSNANAGAVLLTHSYEQDRELLRTLLPLNLKYLGVLGPRSRTLRLVEEIAPSIQLPAASISLPSAASISLSVDECMRRLHAPVGLDLGADAPAGVALAIIAEIHAKLHDRSAIPLREKASASARQ